MSFLMFEASFSAPNLFAPLERKKKDSRLVLLSATCSFNCLCKPTPSELRDLFKEKARKTFVAAAVIHFPAPHHCHWQFISTLMVTWADSGEEFCYFN